MILKELLKPYFLENLDKQILNKIPYCFVSSFVLFSLYTTQIQHFLQNWLLILLVGSFFLSVIGTAVFNYSISKSLENFFIYLDIKSFREKLISIYEGKTSFFDDIGPLSWLETGSFLLSGIALSVFLIVFFLALLSYLMLNHTIVTLLAFLASLYIFYQDILGANLINNSYQKEDRNPFLTDIMEKYVVSNFLEKLPGKRSLYEITMKLASRFLGTPIKVNIPNLAFSTLLVYKNRNIDDLLKKYIHEKTKNQIYLKHLDGLNPSVIFQIKTQNPSGIERISLLKERSALENFPYLFDPSYEYNENDSRKWSMFAIVEKSNKSEKILGYVFVHIFKGAHLKRKLKKISTRPIKIEGELRTIYFFIFLGSRGEINYLKREIELRAPKFDLSVLDLEFEENLLPWKH